MDEADLSSNLARLLFEVGWGYNIRKHKLS